MNRRLLLLSLVLLGLVRLSPVAAEEASAPQAVAKGWGTVRSVHAFAVAPAYEKALAGDCGSLLAMIRPDDADPPPPPGARGTWQSDRALVLGEMLDRALCVPFDPVAAAGHFERALDFYGTADEAAGVLGWKYTYGHGVARSDEEAKRYLDRFLLHLGVFSAVPEGNTESLYALLDGRSLPPRLTIGMAWLRHEMRTMEGRMALIRNLDQGKGEFFDGEVVAIDKAAIRSILISMDDTEEGILATVDLFEQGVFQDRGPLGVDIEYGIAAVRYCHAEAALGAARNYEIGRNGFQHSDEKAWVWYRVAQYVGRENAERLTVLRTRLTEEEKARGQEVFLHLVEGSTCPRPR